jgi:uncharacterized protein YhdP
MRRVLVILSGLILFAVVIAVVGLLTLQGAGKDRIASALSSALGTPVEIGGLSISVLPTPALSASGVRIGNVNAGAAPGLAVADLRVVPSLWSLLPGRTPTITRADLNGLVISIRHTASGEWLAPVAGNGSSSGPAAAPARGAAPAQTPSHTPASPSTASARPAAATTGAKVPSPSGAGKTPNVAVDAFRIRNGAIRIVDEHLRTASGSPTVTSITGIDVSLRYVDGVLSIPDVEAHLGHSAVRASAEAGAKGMTLHLASTAIHNEDLPALLALAGMAPVPGLAFGAPAKVAMTTHVAADFATLTVNGGATIPQLKFGRLALTDVRVPFRLEHDVFTSDSIMFTAYGGHERGRVSVDLSGAPASYGLRTTLDQLDVNQALSATTTMKNLLYGTAHLSADVKGSGMTEAAIEKSLAGTVQFSVHNGEVRNLAVLSTINRVLGGGSGGASDTKFDSLTGTATVANGQARTTDLALRSADLNLLGNGTYGLADQSLNLVLTAQLSPAHSAQIARVVPLSSRLENASGQMQLPVKIAGTAMSPKVEGVAVTAISKTGVQGLVQQLLKR